MSATPSGAGSERSNSPLVPLTDMERSFDENPSRQSGTAAGSGLLYKNLLLKIQFFSEYGGLDYPASESGFSGVSSSTVVTQKGSRKKRADLVMTPQQQRTLAIDAKEDALRQIFGKIKVFHFSNFRTNFSPALNGDQLGLDEQPQPDKRLYIWGTRVCIAELQEEFRRFIRTFCTSVEQLEDDENALQV